jgi:hypothetical protein
MPLLLTLALGVADGGRAFYYQEAVASGARQAIRVAAGSGQQSTGDAACQAAGATTAAFTAHLPFAPGVDRPEMQVVSDQVALEASGDGTIAGTRLDGGTVTLTWHCYLGARWFAVSNTRNQGITAPDDVRSDAISARVDYRFSLITPFVGRLFGGQSVPCSTALTGRADYR